MARSPAPSTCPLGPRLVIQPLLDSCHPAGRHSGWRRATCPVLLTLTATRLIDVTADGQRTNQPSGLTGRLVNTSPRLFLDCTPFLRPRACGGRSLESLRLLANTQRLIAAGSVAEREIFKPRNELQPLLRAGCKRIYPIDRRQRPTPSVGATTPTSCKSERVTPVPVFLTMRVSAG